MICRLSSATITIKFKLLGNMVNTEKVIINQFHVNTSIARTGHKLHGMSKDSLIAHAYNFHSLIEFMLY